MNAAKKFLTATAVAAGALGIGAGAFAACRQELSPGGKTTIYEWSQSEINKWEKRLLAAGVKPEVYRTSKPKHCWARFDTNLLSGESTEKAEG